MYRRGGSFNLMRQQNEPNCPSPETHLRANRKAGNC
jgi:hypothetical protein